MRGAGIRYVQVTHEKLDHAPKTLVGEVFRALMAGGYDGPPPSFGEQWRAALRPRRRSAVGPRRDRIAGER